MPLPLKDLVKLNQIVNRIESGAFDANDVEILLMRLRPYADTNQVFLEISNFVAHPDARDRGLAQATITSFTDSMRYFLDYSYKDNQLIIGEPFPIYVYRLLISQARLVDEDRLRGECRVSRASLIGKIESSFALDKKAGTCVYKKPKCGVEFLKALGFVLQFIHSRPAFDMGEFHSQLKAVMHAQDVRLNEAEWDAQSDRVSLAILCLVSNTEFRLPDGDPAACRLTTENQYRLLSGRRRLPSGVMTDEPKSFGSLIIMGEATVHSVNNAPLRVCFPLISTSLDPHEHCEPGLFWREPSPHEYEDCEVERIGFASDMSLTAQFKLVRADSLIQAGGGGQSN
ncbi:hypothetical protein LVV80_23185 [Pseudomonas sp. KCA11]|uniref:hypothetical protein n=1 Tax=Pseudomonas sp. KCA11 TaxID=2899114 RepID=UPI001F21F150|nr:hypothetical protein [Pseudomonas sp. KCA11]MCE5994901.1 hypothetical protein [Pseudomonas sp. KCA11]